MSSHHARRGVENRTDRVARHLKAAKTATQQDPNTLSGIEDDHSNHFLGECSCTLPWRRRNICDASVWFRSALVGDVSEKLRHVHEREQKLERMSCQGCPDALQEFRGKRS